MDVTEIKKLMSVLDETDVTEISLESDGTKVLLKKDMFAKKKKELEVAQEAQEAIEMEEEIEEISKISELFSLNVGRFYLRDKIGDITVKVGNEVEEGQVVGYIEAIGVKTEVKSDVSGIVKEIKVNDGDTTEFGKVLMTVEIK